MIYLVVSFTLNVITILKWGRFYFADKMNPPQPKRHCVNYIYRHYTLLLLYILYLHLFYYIILYYIYGYYYIYTIIYTGITQLYIALHIGYQKLSLLRIIMLCKL